MATPTSRDPAALRVGIVGAGPAGLSFAYHLRELGVRDITVFDRAAQVGGQSVTVEVDGVPVELGTCYLSSGYVMIASIVREAGCTVEHLPPATLIDDDGQARARDDPPGESARIPTRKAEERVFLGLSSFAAPTSGPHGVGGCAGRRKWPKDQVDPSECENIFSVKTPWGSWP